MVTLLVNIILFQSIIKYWYKILECKNTKYIKFSYELMLSDLLIETLESQTLLIGHLKLKICCRQWDFMTCGLLRV